MSLECWTPPQDKAYQTETSGAPLKDETLRLLDRIAAPLNKMGAAEYTLSCTDVDQMADRWGMLLQVTADQIARLEADRMHSSLQLTNIGKAADAYRLVQELLHIRSLFHTWSLYWHWRRGNAVAGSIQFDVTEASESFDPLRSVTLLYLKMAGVQRHRVWLVVDPYRLAKGKAAFMVVETRCREDDHDLRIPCSCSFLSEYDDARERWELVLRERKAQLSLFKNGESDD